MFPQAMIGTQQDEGQDIPALRGFYLAQVVGQSPQDHAVLVMLPALAGLLSTRAGSNPAGLKARILQHRAGPYVGDLDMPKVGDFGVVVFLHGSDQSAVWLGSLYQDLANLAWEGKRPADRLSHHDSGVYSLVDAAGNAEWVHPSGTRVRVGEGTAKAERNRQERQGQTRRTKPYAVPVKDAPTVHVEHTTGTRITVNPDGSVTIVGKSTKSETIEGAVTEDYQGTKQETVVGGVTESYENSWILSVGTNGSVTVAGNLTITADDLTIASSNPSPGLHLHLGGTTGEDWVALKAALDKIKAAFDAHIHSGVQAGPNNSGVPTAPIPAFVQDTDYSGQAKAT